MSPRGAKAMAVDVGSKSPSSAAPGRYWMLRAAVAARSESLRSWRKVLRSPRNRSASASWPSAVAISIAPSYPFNAQKSSQYECIGFSEYPSWLIDAGSNP
jgi:hypothetical protein